MHKCKINLLYKMATKSCQMTPEDRLSEAEDWGNRLKEITEKQVTVTDLPLNKQSPVVLVIT